METGQTLNPSASLTREEVLTLAQRELALRGLDYDQDRGLWPTYHGHYRVRGGETAPIWSVAYATPARTVELRGRLVEVPPKEYFALINDETHEFLYVHHSTGYLE